MTKTPRFNSTAVRELSISPSPHTTCLCQTTAMITTTTTYRFNATADSQLWTIRKAHAQSVLNNKA